LVATLFAAGDNDGPLDKKQENHYVTLEAAAGTPGRRGQEEKPNRPWVVHTRRSKKRVAELILAVASNRAEDFTTVIGVSSI
jgi:hypothetical protein